MSDNASNEAAEAAGEIEPGSEVSELSQFLVTANRIGAHLEGLRAFEEAELSAADWLLLRGLSESASALSKVSRRIGADRKAIRQRVEEMERTGLIKSETVGGSKGKVLSLTTAGRVLLDRLEEELRQNLAADRAPSAQQIHSARRAATRMAKKLLPKKETQAAAA